jgi:hypothetical protein
MKNLIRKIIKEELISEIDNWQKNLQEFENGNVITCLISKDSENGDRLFLFVGFNRINNFTYYSYSFIVVDENNNNKTDYMVSKNEVLKYLPKNIRNKKLIFPIIEEMTRKLLNNKLPEEIIRKTSEPIIGSSLLRYDMITKIMTEEYGYKVTKEFIDDYGNREWVLSKISKTEKNKNMNEEYVVKDTELSYYDIVKLTFDKIDFSKLVK